MTMARSDAAALAAPPGPTTVLWATQTGRARACARRAIRLLRSSLGGLSVDGRRAFDDVDFLSLGQQQQQRLLILFVSTTGDGEQPSTIQRTWSKLLSKSLPAASFSNVRFALFALGDRAYGPDAFCAAGRKLAARLVQLGAAPICALGYGDDGSPNGGVFADLDVWLEGALFPAMRKIVGVAGGSNDNNNGPAEGGEAATQENLPYQVSVVQSAEIERKDAMEEDSPRQVTIASSSGREEPDDQDEMQEWQQKEFSRHYCKYFSFSCPPMAYRFSHQLERITQQQSGDKSNNSPLLGKVTVNQRLTAEDWMQDTRHITIRITGSLDDDLTAPSPGDRQNLPYQAGDVAAIIPSNPPSLVRRFLSVLPPSVRKTADDLIRIHHDPSHAHETMGHPWPEKCTLRGLLTHCADLQSLPEREDLYALAACCNMRHPEGREQRDKLISLSDPSGAALYGDYVVREKRNWADVFYDFDSLRWEEEAEEELNGNKDVDDGEEMKVGGSKRSSELTLSHLLGLLPSIAPRHFSIASSPSFSRLRSSSSADGLRFEVELCVAVVGGTTPLGRSYAGLCSGYLAGIAPKDASAALSSDDARGLDDMGGSNAVRLWIYPGSFTKLPLNPLAERPEVGRRYFDIPMMCIGAGTGIAPLRSLILEREARRQSDSGDSTTTPPSNVNGTVLGCDSGHDQDNALVFGCRKRSKDYYYGSTWEALADSNLLHLISAFSRDQTRKLYVQRALRDADGGELIARHLLERRGAVYIAGGSRMARAVRDEILEALAARLDGGERDARKLLGRLKRAGRFSVEAWS